MTMFDIYISNDDVWVSTLDDDPDAAMLPEVKCEYFDKERLEHEISIASNEGCDVLEEFIREVLPELFDR